MLPDGRGRSSTVEFRSGHGSGGVVRSARADRKMRARRRDDASRSSPTLPPPPGLDRRRRQSVRRRVRPSSSVKRREAIRHDRASRRARREAARPRHRSRHLRRLSRLRDQLQGMEHRRHRRAADRRQRLSAPSRAASGSTASTPTRSAAAARTRAPCTFPRPACIATKPRLRHRLSHRRLLQARRGRHRAGRRGLCIGCKLCSWACPYGAREFDEDAA